MSKFLSKTPKKIENENRARKGNFRSFELSVHRFYFKESPTCGTHGIQASRNAGTWAYRDLSSLVPWAGSLGILDF